MLIVWVGIGWRVVGVCLVYFGAFGVAVLLFGMVVVKCFWLLSCGLWC